MKIIRTAKAAADIILRGGVIAMPTDTVYGLIAIANRETRKKIIAIKQSPESKKILLLVDSLTTAERIVHMSKREKRFLSRVWPGPVTVVLKNKKAIPGFSGTTLALRVPKNSALLGIMKKISMPLTATSANTSGRPAAKTAQAAFQEFKFSKEKPDAIFFPRRKSAGFRRTRAKMPSSIVAFRGSRIIILREGALARKKLESAWRTSGIGRKL